MWGSESENGSKYNLIQTNVTLQSDKIIINVVNTFQLVDCAGNINILEALAMETDKDH